jgi:hypothetical protein
MLSLSPEQVQPLPGSLEYYTAMKNIAVDKETFDALLKKMIASKPMTFKELVKNPRSRRGKPKGSKKL